MPKDRVTFVSHRNQRVLILDLSDGTLEDISAVIDRGSSVIQRAEPKSILTLTDVTNVIVRDISTRQLVDFVSGNKPFVKAAAVVGLSGITKSILATTNLVTGRSIKPFDSRDQALDWLVAI